MGVWITEPSVRTIREVRITVRSRLKRSLEGFPKESRPLSKSAGAVHPHPSPTPTIHSEIEHIDSIIESNGRFGRNLKHGDKPAYCCFTSCLVALCSSLCFIKDLPKLLLYFSMVFVVRLRVRFPKGLQHRKVLKLFY